MSANEPNTTATACDDSHDHPNRHKFLSTTDAWEHLRMGDKTLNQLLRIDVGDEPDAWSAAGFNVVDGETRLGSTVIRIRGAKGDRGILSLAIDGVTESIDGLTVSPPIPRFHQRITPIHPNFVTHIDHVVAMSPDMDRTVQALSDAGLGLRRTRLYEAGGTTNRQAFFWLGDVILELAGADDAHGVEPAQWWGLAFTSPDLDASHETLGGLLGEPKDAVQPGRRIAGLRTNDIGISVPIVFMSPHPTNDGGSGGYLR